MSGWVIDKENERWDRRKSYRGDGNREWGKYLGLGKNFLYSLRKSVQVSIVFFLFHTAKKKKKKDL